jgi:hypothetical protein
LILTDLPAQLAEAENSVCEWLNKARRFEPSTAQGQPSGNKNDSVA